MPELTITHENHGKKGRFVARLKGVDGEGELTYSRVNPKLIIADHTGVPDALAGQGIAKALVEHLIRDARQNDYRIVPLCPYVRARADKNPDWDDVIVR